MNKQRRRLLRTSLTTGAIATGFGSGLLTVNELWASWPQNAFEATTLEQIITALHGKQTPQPSTAIELTAPDVAENGANVAIQIATTLKAVQSIALVVLNNAQPLVANFRLSSSMQPYLATRIKLLSSSTVVVLVKNATGLYANRKEIKITTGA